MFLVAGSLLLGCVAPPTSPTPQAAVERVVLVTPDWQASATYPDDYASVEYGASTFADLDGDGYRDLVLTLGQVPRVYRGDGAGGLTPGAEAPGDHACAAGRDLDGDGVPEIVCPSYGMKIYNVDPMGTIQTLATLMTGMTYSGFGRGLSLGDVNGDGFGDVAIGQAARFITDPASGMMRWMLGGPDRETWAWHNTVPLGGTETWTTLRVSTGYDVEGDGYDDTVVSQPACGNPLAGWRAATAPAIPADVLYFPGGAAGPQATPGWSWSAVRGPEVNVCDGWDAQLSPDVNGDGHGDLIISGLTTVHVLPGTPTGPGATPLWTTTGAPGCWGRGVTTCQVPVVRGVPVGDTDGDGLGDIAIVEADHVRVHLGRPGGVTEQPQWVLAPGPGPMDVAQVGDRNGDGRDELLVLTPFGDGPLDNFTGTAWLFDGRAVLDRDRDGVDDSGDCAPHDPGVFPGATESLGNQIDENCNGLYGCAADLDGDGAYGTLVEVPMATESCQSAGLSDQRTDCADDDPTSTAMAEEIPGNDADEDCDGMFACYLDLDGDGAGGQEALPSAGIACSSDPRYNVDRTDCDDDNIHIGPLGVESPGNNLDEDCDGHLGCYADRDGDGVGAEGTFVLSPDLSCTHPGFSDAGSDCVDDDPTIHPGAALVPSDTIDQDCSGQIECWSDVDRDGWGGVVRDYSVTTCQAAAGTATVGGDCLDSDLYTWPGAPEVEDGSAAPQRDNNCDGVVFCLVDEDDDSWGTTETVEVPVAFAGAGAPCIALPNLASRGTDCDDQSPQTCPWCGEDTLLPGDENCDGVEWCCDYDVDGDGQESVSVCTPAAMEPGRACPPPPAAPDPRDCDDHDPESFAGGVDLVGDDIDQDCDGYLTCYGDLDGDGYRGSDIYEVSSEPWCTLLDPCIIDADGDGYFDTVVREPLPSLGTCPEKRDGDCDDQAADIHPWGQDLGGDGIDGDCDGIDGLDLTISFQAPYVNFTVSPIDAPDVIVLLVSTVGPGRGPCMPILEGACVHLRQPKVLFERGIWSQGPWTARYRLSPGLSGRTVWFQAWDDEGDYSSAPMRWTVP